MESRRNLGVAVAVVLAFASWGVGAAAGAPAARNVITYAEAPGASPNYIFPFASCQYYSSSNMNQFQMLMYRPLYWFGLGGSPSLVPSLSLAEVPRFTNGDRTVTISLKGWRFADGQIVNARSVLFFLNMYRADPTAFCGYNAGFGIPDQVRNAAGTGDTVQINFATPVNPNWMLDNYLSEITPLPDVWDRTSPTRGARCASGVFGAASTKAACTAVAKYLSSVASDTATFTKPLWQSGVDGPWRLTAFDHLGNATFQPNPRYSGPQKAQVTMVKERAYTSDLAEETDLRAGRLSIGYLDPSVLESPALATGRPGPNWSPLDGHYTMTVGATWSFNFAALNFSTADPKSAAINQLYIRQALQMLIDQGTLIEVTFKGYGSPVYSPLPPQIPRQLAAPVANPYPFNPTAAQSLFATHGWTVEGGALTCVSPGTGTGQCGPGISAGYTLSFNVVIAAGSATLSQAIAAEAANWRAFGIGVTVLTASLSNVLSDCTGGSGFEICEWGTGWTYEPGNYPSGEALFTPGGGSNIGTYNDPAMTALISASTQGSGSLAAYADYAAKQLPVLYQPQPMAIQETIRGLKSTVGLTPNPLGNFMPEYFHF
ncbi:MAG: ABC transporter substrate-binding protein [Acidimicrobiales bacterium]